MSIRWRDGRPIVELYDPATKTKRHIKPREFGMDLRGLTGRRLERAAKELELKALDNLTASAGNPDETCDSFAARWAEDFTGTRSRPRGPSTRIVNAERVGRFGADFAGRPLRTITRDEARQWATAHAYRVPAVRAMFNDAVDVGLADHNPFARIGITQGRGRRDLIVLSRDDVHALADTALAVHGDTELGHDMRALLLWAAYTCLRPGEVFASRYTNLHGDVYDVRTQFNSHLRRETPPKYGSDGLIFVAREARDAVLGKPRRMGDELMFRTARGRQFRRESWHYTWQPVRVAFTAGLPATHELRRRQATDPKDLLDLHELRHFGASYMLNVLGLEAWVIAKQLRHDDDGSMVLRLYGHPERTVAIDKIRAAYGENVEPLRAVSGESQGRSDHGTR